jgi:hypothetical protein
MPSAGSHVQVKPASSTFSHWPPVFGGVLQELLQLPQVFGELSDVSQPSLALPLQSM